jgi:hypothetical protein
MKRIHKLWLLPVIVSLLSSTAVADVASDWNRHLLEALRTANTPPHEATRIGAIVQAAVFDAVNGIEGRFTQIHVPPAVERNASKRAAVIQAAYGTMVKLFPSQKLVLDAKRQISLSELAGDGSAAVTRGIEWGQTVADAILNWRSTDGFTPAPPPYLGGTAIGQWRPTPPANAPGAGSQFATMTPWLIPSPSAFRPAGPPALNSARYAQDFDEVKRMGSVSSADRSADQTLTAFFWASTTPVFLWNDVAASLLESRLITLSDEALVFGVLNVAMGDATISCWDAKYHYSFWRPITAIQLAADDGNPDTTADPAWTPLIATPAHPEYPSGHSCNSSAAAHVLAAFFGELTRFTMESEVMIGVTRSFQGFSSATAEVKNARIFGGMHFRSACDDGEKIGIEVANHVLHHVLFR